MFTNFSLKFTPGVDKGLVMEGNLKKTGAKVPVKLMQIHQF